MSNETTNKNFTVFILALLPLLLHLMRNISVFYFAIQGLLLLSVFSICRKSANITTAQIIGGILFFWWYAVIMSFFYSDLYGDPLIGIARLTFIVPYIALFFIIRRNQKESLYIWKVLVLFVAIAALTIPYQMIFGGIEWFAEPGERAGILRYSSLAGSLTSFGGIVGAALFVSFILFKGIAKFLLAIIFIVCAVLSLQKAAIGGVLVAFALLYWIGRLRFSISFITGILLFVVVIFTVLEVDESTRDFSLLFLSGAFGFADQQGMTDVTIKQSMIDRFTELPLESLNFFGLSSVIHGVGVFGGSGGLGYADYPMMHNLIGETFIIFGIPCSIVIISFLLKYFVLSLSICRRTANNDKVAIIAGSVFISTLTVGIFSGSLFYQPVIGAFFWFSLSELVRYKMKNQRYSIKTKSLRGVMNV
jgi:hypothetical protein